MAAISFMAMGCGASPALQEDESDDSAEGALFGFGSRTSDVVIVARTIVDDAALTQAVAQSGKKVNREPELSGGLVFLAGSDMGDVHYGIVCTPRDGSCLIRWITRTREIAPIRFGGELGKKVGALFPKGFDGSSTRIACSADGCDVSVDGLAENMVEFVDTKVDAERVRTFAGM